MDRRKLLYVIASGVAGATLVASPSAAQKVFRIAHFYGSRAGNLADSFIQGLNDFGYFEGKNIILERRVAEVGPPMFESFPPMAAELIRSGLDVFVAGTATIAQIIQKETTSVPIVALGVHDGVAVGLFESLARPGRNMTGIDTMAPNLDAKRLQLAKEVLPGLSHLTVLLDPTFPGAEIHRVRIAPAAETLGMTVRFVEVSSIPDVAPALAAILANGTDAVYVIPAPLIFGSRKEIIDFGALHKLPMFHEFKVFVEDGGLLSYGPDINQIWRRGGYYVDRILKGHKAGDIPVEQPTTFDLAINLTTAKALGIQFPHHLIASASAVIE